jgi:hypothetical protein
LRHTEEASHRASIPVERASLIRRSADGVEELDMARYQVIARQSGAEAKFAGHAS